MPRRRSRSSRRTSATSSSSPGSARRSSSPRRRFAGPPSSSTTRTARPRAPTAISPRRFSPMTRKKRASMREGPLADLFRSTDESVAPDEVKVTANGAGNSTVEVAVEEPVQETPAPEPTPPDPVAEATDAEPSIEIHHEGLERLMGGPGIEIRPAYGRDEPDTSSPTRQPVVPRTHQAVLRVVGVGGAGVNAVNRMVEAELPGVEFLAINTDLQSLQSSNADVTLHIGSELTRGLGSGSDPRVGYRAAYEEQDKIKELLKGSDMVFLASGSGGGTGTGAAPVVAKLARDIGALTVAAVTKPFTFEGARRMAQAEEGIAALA